MRKTVMALILIVPILFVFVLYGVTKVDLHANINANGIEILGKPAGETLRIDLAEYNSADHAKFEIETKVTPEQANNREYTYQYIKLAGKATEEEVAAGKVVRIEKDEDGKSYVRALAVGTVRVVAVSSDGGFTDSFTVVVGSSKVSDFDFMLYDLAEGASDSYLSDMGDGYAAEGLSTGRYRYATKLYPGAFTAPVIETVSGTAMVDESGSSVLFPFSGKTELEVTIPNGVPNGEGKTKLSKRVSLDLKYPEEAAFTVNGLAYSEGGEDATRLFYERGRLNAQFYLETKEGAVLEGVEGDAILSSELVAVGGKENCYLVSLEFDEMYANDIEEQEHPIRVVIDGEKHAIPVVFSEFSFTIKSGVPSDSGKAIILLDTPVSFFPVPVSSALDTRGIRYEWDLVNANWAKIRLDDYKENDGKVCTITAKEGVPIGDGVPVLITAQAYRGNVPLEGGYAELEVDPVHYLTQVQVRNNTEKGLARSETVAGYRFDADSDSAPNRYALDILTINEIATEDSAREPKAVDDLVYSFSTDGVTFTPQSNLAEVVVEKGTAYVVPKGTGIVYVKAEWSGNASFNGDEGEVFSVIKLNVVKEAVAVETSSQLFRETDKERPRPIVITKDIMLGTEDNGKTPLPIDARRALVKKMKSTYNTQYFDNTGTVNEANVGYIVEFKNDVYGNGYKLNAEYIANALDGSDMPQIFRGPICLVRMGDAASVAGQDNISFLVRTDNVVLHNLELLGCSDESLYDEAAGANNLTRLNNVGTVLEINCDAHILNCRIRNGRNVVRAYGGNKKGESYFVKDPSEVGVNDYIDVRIEGCILTNGREFILKMGANHAIRATQPLGCEPDLPAINNKTYVPGGNYIDDEQFCKNYVLTDVTVKNSVFKTSGFFCVGIESNFAGEFLGPESSLDGWTGVGGTSFASTLRLEGDVRLYDWKDISLVDSSTLIESNALRDWLKLDVQAMIDFVQKSGDAAYSDILKTVDEKQYVHGGIAFYGGGKNYSQLDISALDETLQEGLKQYNINIGYLANADNETLQVQGQMLPYAAGTQDFRFFLYNNTSPNSYEAQSSNESYAGIQPVSPF